MSSQIEHTECCIIGAGPGGAVLALLLARRGMAVTLLEAHEDFDREFRGDTLHPSTLCLMDQLELLDKLLEIPHTRHQKLTLNTPKGSLPYLDFSTLGSPYPYILRMPQPRFLQFVTHEAARYPNFQLLMGARAEELLQLANDIHGVRYRARDGLHDLEAHLVVGADGRFSRVRELAGLRRTPSRQPIDLLWFRLPRYPTDPPTDGGLFVRDGRFAFVRNRGDAWQVALMLPKGSYQHIRSAGLAPLRGAVASLVPWLGDRTQLLENLGQTWLLSVESSRLRRWYRSGLLLIGDAAHVMSPVGGVGINLAIQDAVAVANLVGPHIGASGPSIRQLSAVQRRREPATRTIQALQDLLLEHILSSDNSSRRWPTAGRVAEKVPLVRALRTRLFAFGGFLPERISRKPIPL